MIEMGKRTIGIVNQKDPQVHKEGREEETM
jgi:hypothetical protein